MKDSLIAAVETKRGWASNKREVGTIPTRTYLYPTAAAMAMVELTTSTFYALAKRAGVHPVEGRGRAGSPYLWDADSINRIAAEKMKMPKYAKPRSRWQGEPVNVEVVER